MTNEAVGDGVTLTTGISECVRNLEEEAVMSYGCELARQGSRECVIIEDSWEPQRVLDVVTLCTDSRECVRQWEKEAGW